MSCAGSLCERCYGIGCAEIADPVVPATVPPLDDPFHMTRTALEAEVRAHRRLWTTLAAANLVRLEVHELAEATKDLPPPQTSPYIRANDVRLQAVQASFASDADLLRALTAIMAQWPAFQKSG